MVRAALLRAGDVVVVDETVEVLLVGSLSVAQCVKVLRERGQRHGLGGAVGVVLEVLGDASEEEQGKDHPDVCYQSNKLIDCVAGGRRPRDEDVIRAEVWVADAETVQRGVLGDEGRGDAGVSLQVLDMV